MNHLLNNAGREGREGGEGGRAGTTCSYGVTIPLA